MEKKQQVMQWLDNHSSQLQQLLSSFVRIPSFTGNEYDMQMAVKAFAEEAGLQVRQQAFDEEQRRPCLLITYPGTGEGKCLMLDAHADTVIVHKDEKWEHDPLSGDFDGTWIHGRGATDDKWGIATALMMLKALKECDVQLPGDVKLLVSVGEEGGLIGGSYSRRYLGAGAMVRTMEKAPDFCIVCEESTNTIGMETPKSMAFTLSVSGKTVHTCVRRQCIYPQNSGFKSGNALGVDALQKALPIIDALYRLERDLSVNFQRGGMIGTGGMPGGPRGSIGAFTMNPIEITGGGTNTLMANVTVRYGCHFSPFYTHEEIWELIEDTVKGVAMTDLWLRENPPVLKRGNTNNGFSTDPAHPGIAVLGQAHAQVHGKPALVKDWVAGCDADAMNDVVPCVVYGPTGMGAHSPNERSKLSDLVEAAKVYALTAMDFCQ